LACEQQAMVSRDKHPNFDNLCRWNYAAFALLVGVVADFEFIFIIAKNL
jgi:hypothetical protein